MHHFATPLESVEKLADARTIGLILQAEHLARDALQENRIPGVKQMMGLGAGVNKTVQLHGVSIIIIFGS